MVGERGLRRSCHSRPTRRLRLLNASGDDQCVSVYERIVFGKGRSSTLDTSVLVQTLFANGFLLENSHNTDNVLLLTCSRLDEFGVANRYLIAHSDSTVDCAAARGIDLHADAEDARPLIVGSAVPDVTTPSLSEERFLARLGGGVTTLLPLESVFAERLMVLGDNRLPNSMSGRADTLFEVYVEAGLQFLLGRRVIRYGQSRSGEALPDGVVVREGRHILYDAKAASGGFALSRDVIRQFASYVQDFTERYGPAYGAPYAFLVVSGSFRASGSQLDHWSRELYAETGSTLLSTLDARELSHMCRVFSGRPALRGSVDWSRLLAQASIDCKLVMRSVRAAKRDGILPGGANSGDVN